MQVDAIGTDLGQQVNEFDGRHPLAYRLAEGIAAHVADCPQAKGEFVFRSGLELICHFDFSCRIAIRFEVLFHRASVMLSR